MIAIGSSEAEKQWRFKVHNVSVENELGCDWLGFVV